MTLFGKETFGSFLSALRPVILHLTATQLRDEALTEDIIWKTLAVAWGEQRQFRGEAGLKTWVMTTLKDKIVDHFCRSRHSGISLENP